MPTKDGLTTYSDLLRANERFDRARLRYEAALKCWATVAEKRLRDAPAIAAPAIRRAAAKSSSAKTRGARR
jgi:hypothetical protein